jgi:hypothetical protein
MDSADKYKSSVAFIDILFNILIGFVFLFLIAFLLINPITKKNDIISPAEFLIVLSWPPDLDDDVDLWMRGPKGETVGFRSKEVGIFHLERDDLGYANDKVIHSGDVIAVKKNQETIAIRGIYPGEYLVSVMYYATYDLKNPNKKIPINVELIKINPYKIVYTENKVLSAVGQTVNFLSFSINEQGVVYAVRETGASAVPFNRAVSGSTP